MRETNAGGGRGGSPRSLRLNTEIRVGAGSGERGTTASATKSATSLLLCEDRRTSCNDQHVKKGWKSCKKAYDVFRSCEKGWAPETQG